MKNLWPVLMVLLMSMTCEKKNQNNRSSNCDLKPDAGPCEAAIPKYYYDNEEQKCKTFLWGGCGGTVPFDTFEECLSCVDTDPCELEPEAGPCFAAIPKYYYDKNEGMCKEFIWGGCGGTVPFDSMEECQTCLGK